LKDPHHHLNNSIPPGTVDVLCGDMRVREHVLSTIRSVYEKYGFTPQHTPILEHACVFDGHHGEGEKLLFHLTDKRGTPLVLRYDLTVPLARVASMYPSLPRPYKRFQIAQVFRDDKEDKGHFREFTQCDGDVVGADTLIADAEVISLAHTGLTELGFTDFTIRINHRQILAGIAEKIGMSKHEAITVLCRAIDSADKITKDGLIGVKRDLAANGIDEQHVDTIARIVAVKGHPSSALPELRRLIGNSSADQGIDELEEILSYLPSGLIDDLKIDVSLARGADYYTGFILEGIVNGIPIGAVLGGGRYDNLVAAFGSAPEPAVGMAFGLDRILTAAKELGMYNDDEVTPEKFLVVAYEGSTQKALLEFAMTLRSQGFGCDFYLGSNPQEDAVKAYAQAYKYRKIATVRFGDIVITDMISGLSYKHGSTATEIGKLVAV